MLQFLIKSSKKLFLRYVMSLLKNSIWPLIQTWILCYNMSTVDLTANISQWENMLYYITLHYNYIFFQFCSYMKEVIFVFKHILLINSTLTYNTELLIHDTRIGNQVVRTYFNPYLLSHYTKVVTLNPVHGEMYSIQHYVIKLVSDRSVVFSGFLHQ